MALPINPNKLPDRMSNKDFIKTLAQASGRSVDSVRKEFQGTSLSQAFSYGHVDKTAMKKHLGNLPQGLEVKSSRLKSAFEKATPQIPTPASSQTSSQPPSASTNLRPKGPGFLGRMFGSGRSTTPSSRFSGSAGANNPNTISPSNKSSLPGTKFPGVK